MLFAIISLNAIGRQGMLVYTVAYSVASICFFAILIKMKDYTYEGFNGLAKKEPVMAATATICLLSLAGIPLTGGFFAKYYVLSAAVEQGKWIGIVIFAVLMAAISAYYYFRLIRSMYFAEGEATLSYKPSSIEKALLLVNALLVILLGVLPGIL